MQTIQPNTITRIAPALQNGLLGTTTTPPKSEPSASDQWKYYQEKVNRKEHLSNSELFDLVEWLRNQPPSNNLITKINHIMQVLRKRGLQIDMQLYSKLIYIHIKRGKFSEVPKVLEAIETDRGSTRLSQQTLALLMAMHLKTGNTEELEKVIRRPNNPIAHYMAQFLQWTKGLQLSEGQIQTAKGIYRILQDQNCEPNTPRFTSLLTHLFDAEKAVEAFALVNHVLDIGYRLNHYTRTTVMSGLLKARRFNDAASIYPRIVGGGGEPIDTSIVNSLLSSLSKNPRSLGVAREVWECLNSTPGLKPDAHSFASMLSGYIGANDPTSAMRLWETMQRPPHSLRPNAILYNLMINGLFYTHRPDMAKRLYRQFSARTDLHQSITLHTYRIMIGGLLSVKDLEGLQAVMDKMKEDKIEPDTETYTLMADILFRQSDTSSGGRIADLMSKTDLAKNTVTYTVLVAGYARNGDMPRAQELYAEMQAAGHQPSIETYGALMQGAFRSGQPELAEEMVRVAKEKAKGGMSAGAYSIMVSGYSQLVMLDKAETWLQEMRRRHGVPWETYYALLRACVEHRQWEPAQRVVEIMKEQNFVSHVPKLNKLVQEVEKVRLGTIPLAAFGAKTTEGSLAAKRQ